MIKSFRHAGIEKFFFTGSKAGIQPRHANKLNVQLTTLNKAKGPADMAAPGLEASLIGWRSQGTLGSNG
jgi:proteic killer suppression protein